VNGPDRMRSVEVDGARLAFLERGDPAAEPIVWLTTLLGRPLPAPLARLLPLEAINRRSLRGVARAGAIECPTAVVWGTRDACGRRSPRSSPPGSRTPS
jgi:hypothetical protein